MHGTPESLDPWPQLRAVVIPYAGVPKRTRELVAAHPGVTLHNLHHNAVPTAETAFALMLAAAKSVVPIDRALRRADWRPRYEQRQDLLLHGAKAVILGYGAIGHAIAGMCRGLGHGRSTGCGATIASGSPRACTTRVCCSSARRGRRRPKAS